MYKYKFIGNGAQFRVYSVYTLDDRHTGRVIKVPLNYEETLKAIIEPLALLAKHKSRQELDNLADNRAREVMGLTHDIPGLVQGVIGADKNFNRKIGDLKILQVPISAEGTQYPGLYYLPTLFTQDYIVTLDEYFNKFRIASNKYVSRLDYSSVANLKNIINQIVKLNFEIWKYGIFEFVFKPENFGIRYLPNGKPELIWMDLGEYITDIKQAELILSEKRWQHAQMTHKVDYQFLPLILHKYYDEACSKAFTVSNLRKYWRKNNIRIEKKQGVKLKFKEKLVLSKKQKLSYWVSRHDLNTALYQGFCNFVIDDMEIPAQDIKKLLNDNTRVNAASSFFFPEERIERLIIQAKQQGYADRVPLISVKRFREV